MKVVCFSIGANYAHLMDVAAYGMISEGYDIELVAAEGADMDADPLYCDEMLGETDDADIVFIRVHGDVTFFRKFPRLRKKLESNGTDAVLECNSDSDVTKEHRCMFGGSDDEYDTAVRYMGAGGNVNCRYLLMWALNRYGGTSFELPEPELPPAFGAMIPGDSEPRDIGEAVASLGRDVPRAAVFFHRNFWVSGNYDPAVALAEAFRKRGGDAVAIFTDTYPDPGTGAIGIAGLCDRYLIRDGVPQVDCVIMTMGFSLTMNVSADAFEQEVRNGFIERLGVPVIQTMLLYGPQDAWHASPYGLSSPEIGGSVISPEYDGQIITVPCAGYERMPDGSRKYVPMENRCSVVADISYRWSMLSRKRNSEKKVAILLYMYPPRNDLAGGATGLDTMESTADLMRRMSGDGYVLDWVPENGREVVERLLSGITNDDSSLSDDQIRERASYMIKLGDYSEWLDREPGRIRDDLVSSWGEPPGDLHVFGKDMFVPGFVTGNVFVGLQPDRGKTDSGSYHDPDTAPPHQYLGFYRWLRDVFGADAVIHMGTHGTLEWLPGKSVGLSDECFPDAVLGAIPNINPYIIDNPGEGMQAKRRGYAVDITHMIPSMTRADSYGDIAELEGQVQSFLRSDSLIMDENSSLILASMKDTIGRLSMYSDLGLSEDCTPEDIRDASDRIYDRIAEIKDALITDGLHILGRPPDGERMLEAMYSMLRLDNGCIPSLRNEIASYRGLDFKELRDDPSGITGGVLNGELADAVDCETMDAVRAFSGCGFSEDGCREYLSARYPGHGPGMDTVAEYVCRRMYPDLMGTTGEIESIMRALDGGFVRPGPSGSPTRGRAQILPTGRNFYSIDPDGIPWHSSWDIGRKMADDMVTRYREEHGSYPETVGINVWATDTMRTGGDDIAYVLWLLGLRPIWDSYGGRVTELEVVPVAELGRPRVDVTLRISGLFRDAFPNLVDMLDDGIRTIASLDESDESNRLAANLRKDVQESIARGIPEDEALAEASVRIFGDAPGRYGCGVSGLITNGRWDTAEDLGEKYISTGGYGYGRGIAGRPMKEGFRRNLSRMQVTVKNHSSREVDLFDMDDDYDFLGGMNAAVKAAGGDRPESYMGDSSDTGSVKLRTLEEETRFVFRSKINNPKWLEGLKRHGYRGAQDISQVFDYMIGWDGTSGTIEKWMYDSVARDFLLDTETREWIKRENPHALMNMLERLNEAVARGLWDADPDLLGEIRSMYLELEEYFEEMSG